TYAPACFIHSEPLSGQSRRRAAANSIQAWPSALSRRRERARSEKGIGYQSTARNGRHSPSSRKLVYTAAVILRMILLLGACVVAALGQSTPNWVTVWAASAQGPYPTGNASAQPNLSFAFPTPAAGAHDQTFRLIVQPDIWGREARLRLSNAFGTRPVTFD